MLDYYYHWELEQAKLVVCLTNIFYIYVTTLPHCTTFQFNVAVLKFYTHSLNVFGACKILLDVTYQAKRGWRLVRDRQRRASEKSQVAGKKPFSPLMHAREARIQQQRTAMRKALILLCMLTNGCISIVRPLAIILSLAKSHRKRLCMINLNTRDTSTYKQTITTPCICWHAVQKFYTIYSTCTAISIKVHQYLHTVYTSRGIKSSRVTPCCCR